MKLTAKEFAALLDGNSIENEISIECADMAKECGLVVVYGYSDDCIEFEGAVMGEGYVAGGGTVFVNNEYFSEEPNGGREIKAVWHDDVDLPCWTYETDIPHETFRIYEEGAVFCEGIVFSVEDL